MANRATIQTPSARIRSAAALVLGLSLLSLPMITPASAEVGECDNKPGACGLSSGGRGAQPRTAPQPLNKLPPPVARPQPQPAPRVVQPQPVPRVVQPQAFPAPGYRPPNPPERRGGDYRRRDGDGDRRSGGEPGRRVYRGPGIAAGAVIIGSILAYSAYRGPNRENVYARCDRKFPDFDYDTGTYVNEDGDRELCPYLEY